MNEHWSSFSRRWLSAYHDQSAEERFKADLILGLAVVVAAYMGAVSLMEFIAGTWSLGLIVGSGTLAALLCLNLLARGWPLALLGTGLVASIYALALLVIALTGGRAFGAVIMLPALVFLAILLATPNARPAWLLLTLLTIVFSSVLRSMDYDFPVEPDPYWAARSIDRLPFVATLLLALTAVAVQRAMQKFQVQLNAAVAREESMRRLAESSAERFEEFADIASDGFWETDAELRLSFLSPGFARTMGTKIERVLGKTPEEAIRMRSPGMADLSAMMDPMRRRVPYANQLLQSEDAQGNPMWLVNRGRPRFDAEGQFLGYRGAVHNITEQKRVEQTLRDNEQRLHTITDNLPALISYIDQDGYFRFNNRTYEEWLSRPVSEITGHHLTEVYTPETYALVEPYLRRALAGEKLSFDLSQDGLHDRYVRVTYVPEFDDQTQVRGVYALIHDVTQFKLIERRLRDLSEIDGLTGLPNRRRYDEALGEAIARSDRSGVPMGVLFVDLDHFKQLNDQLGHEAGDQALREFARRVHLCVRQTDVVARLGGDEFVVVLGNLATEQAATAVAEKILSVLEMPIEIQDQIWQLSASIGVAFRAHAGICEDTLLRAADKALYAAKAAGRGGYSVAEFEVDKGFA